MKPVDYRNVTWHRVLLHVSQDMRRVHLAWQAHGPGTTREVAQKAGISILTFRPRTTDLYKLGLVELVPGIAKGEGVYEYRTAAQAEASTAWQQRADFSRTGRAPTELQRVGFITVDEAVGSLEPAAQARLGAQLLGRWGHLLKKREAIAGAEQLSFC